MSDWQQYRRTNIAEMRPFVPGEDLSEISVSATDDPETDHGMIARNPDNHRDQWYVARAYCEKNFEVIAQRGEYGDVFAALAALVNQAHEYSEDHERALIEEAHATVRRHLIASTPQQPEDALAVRLDRIAKATPGSIDTAPESVAVYREWWQFIQETAAEARQALTASGATYVPEEVRRHLDFICDLERVTREGGAEPEDLSELESAIHIAIQCANDAISALASAPAVTDGWQPIETAPKDGTFVLVYEGSATRRMWRAQWVESIGWMFGATSDGHIACEFFRVAPTHWMPLPAEPNGGK